MEIKKVDIFSERVFQAVTKLIPQLAPNAELPTSQYFKDLLASDNIHFFTAELENGYIGGMLTIGTYNIPTGKKVWIEDVVVDESQRGKGVGKELMLFAMDYSRSLGAKEIELTSKPSRIAANKLYQELGFIAYETNVYKYPLR